jgi:hypothetical protein
MDPVVNNLGVQRMAKPSGSVYARVGLAPEERLRWLLSFGNLEPASLNAERRAAAVQEARAFLMIEEVDPEVRPLLRIGPPPQDETPNVLTQEEVWAAQRWLMEGRTAAPERGVEFRRPRQVRTGPSPRPDALGPTEVEVSSRACSRPWLEHAARGAILVPPSP